jgi:hypothetical protein
VPITNIPPAPAGASTTTGGTTGTATVNITPTTTVGVP